MFRLRAVRSRQVEPLVLELVGCQHMPRYERQTDRLVGAAPVIGLSFQISHPDSQWLAGYVVLRAIALPMSTASRHREPNRYRLRLTSDRFAPTTAMGAADLFTARGGSVSGAAEA